MKYYGKEKCRILKEIRAEIAKANDIEWVVSECKHQGNCKGTCPKCEQEVRQLEDALARREALGKKVAVVGISATIALSVTGCESPFATAGDMQVEPGEPVHYATTAEETFTEVYDGEMPPIPGGETECSTDETQEWVLRGDPISDGEIEMGEFPEDTAIETDEEAAADTEAETETDPVVTDLMGEPAL